MSLMALYTIPLTAVSLVIAYRFFKLPKQDVGLIRKMLFKDNVPIVFGHRAGHFEAPENTLVAIETAKKNNATAVEIDLEFTKDGKPILFHDDDVDRVTNGKGKLSDILFQDLRKLNAAESFNYTITSEGKENLAFEKIPTLLEAVDLCRKHNLVIDLDVKSNGKGTCKALKYILQKYPESPTFLFVTSFSPSIIYNIRKECPEFFTGLIWRYHYLSRTISGVPRYSWYITPALTVIDKVYEIMVHYWLPDFLGISLLAMHKDHISTNYVNAWQKKNVELITWTVNSPVEKEYFMRTLNIPIVTDSLLDSVECEEQTS